MKGCVQWLYKGQSLLDELFVKHLCPRQYFATTDVNFMMSKPEIGHSSV